ncbi:DNA mismatch endonuclease Vsr [Cupriavidus oxalaticus]|uniref:Very short patch repair endonuclease n=2 Tax=Cupriavidus oxalaticus TaxID=96344 RepID=A0A5P3VH39_9BURK|nr:DNA mismatch endonuclease Vsr [Cupriavidus oxalaticus]QEZ45235.1 DNA mismatch endonuclease Vsr [Cupriavidus oxalaticus]
MKNSPVPEPRDPLTPQQRSERMSRIRSRDTKPEMCIRRLVHGMGYRYRLHRRGVPGTPDLVFSSRKKVIFVHGCFWHLHGCTHYKMPQTRREFWLKKLEANVQRDQRVLLELANLGWESLVIWECELRDVASLRNRIVDFLGSASKKRDTGKK